MRVIAGIHKGRKIKTVSGFATRPTSDKVKEAVFQVMGPFFSGGSVLDLFAGSGALGIEALSRGMDFAVFIDRQSKAIHTVKENLNSLGIIAQAEFYRNDASRGLHILAKRGLQFELILLDPPYDKANITKLLSEISRLALLKENGYIFCEHNAAAKLPESINDYSILKHSNYGSSIGVTIYQNTIE